ncbi:hypothetical protein B0O99DRAFT_696149 [Bisporella sp. PMI_857]|nr:hypothetical protein B0O99DRAFT_696149 [Bisporella sp. PMI_857]
MAELSLAVNIVQIISTCTATIKTIDHVIKKYKEAPKKLESLASEVDLIKALLNQLSKVLKGKSSFYSGKLEKDLDLRAAIDRTLTGCWTVFLLLHKELGKLLPEATKDVNYIQRLGLLFNDEIIQDYRSQIRGHVQGLESVLSCLQAQTVSETHELLRKASETLEQIASATLNIREQHKEYSFPESVYEGYTTFEEDKHFDQELLNTSAYRAAFQIARKNSLIDGSASFVIGSSQSARTRKQPSKDFLSDQPLEERNSTLENIELLDTEGIGDLIKLTDDTDDWNRRHLVSPSALLMDREGLSWDSLPGGTVPHLLDEEFTKTIANKVEKPTELLRELNQSINKEDPIKPLSQPPLVTTHNSITVQESKDILAKHGDRRDSGQEESNQVPSASPELYHHSDTSTLIHLTDEKFSITTLDEKIPVWSEQTINGRASSASSMSCFGSTSTANTRTTSCTFTSTSADLSPLSPDAISPFSEHMLPANHRWSNPPAYIPLADSDLEQHLLDTMQHCLVSPDPVVRLDWAEDTLRHCSVGAAHEKRLAEMKVKKKTPQTTLSERESVLMTQATQVVQELRREEYGRAYFLSARYIVPPEEKTHLHLLAYSREHHRSLFYLGEMCEEAKSVKDAMKRYKDGADRGDAACLYRLAQAHLDGQLGIKKDKEKGISFLQKAAEAADKDCPDSLHHLAILHLEPSRSKIKSSLNFSSSKPLVQHSVSAALTHLRRAAFLGHGPSQLRLGQYHRYGDFDTKGAKKASRKPSLSGTTLSRRNSSFSAASAGMGDAEIDPTLAKHYLHLASRRGLPEADYEIAYDLLWDDNRLTKQHDRLAYSHATRALLGGVPQAYGLMGKAYEDGIGCKKNLDLAEKYYYEGRKKGDDWARARSDALRNQGIGLDGNEFGYIGGGRLMKG